MQTIITNQKLKLEQKRNWNEPSAWGIFDRREPLTNWGCPRPSHRPEYFRRTTTEWSASCFRHRSKPCRSRPSGRSALLWISRAPVWIVMDFVTVRKAPEAHHAIQNQEILTNVKHMGSHVFPRGEVSVKTHQQTRSQPFFWTCRPWEEQRAATQNRLTQTFFDSWLMSNDPSTP